MFLLLFGGVNVAAIRLRKSHPELDRGFRIPLVPLTPILAIATMLFVAVFVFFAYPMAWLAAGGWIAAGLVFYYAYSRKRETAYTERAAWMERIERKEYRVLVAVSSPRTVRSLMEAGVSIAREYQGDLVAMTVAEVPEGESLLAGQRLVRELEPVLEEAVAYARAQGVRARPLVKIGHRISHALVQAVREEQCNFLIIGQPYAQSFFERIVSTIVERVLQDAPCQVGVVYGTIEREGIRHVVVPVTAGANSKLAAELAPALSRWFEVDNRALTVIEDAIGDDEAARLTDRVREVLGAARYPGRHDVLRRRDMRRGLTRAIKRGDLVLLGAPTHGPIVPLWGDTIPALIAKRGRNAVVVVRDVAAHRVDRFEDVFFRKQD